jgi:hypothetical protein
VVASSTFSQSSAVGTSNNYARADHVHGTPASPVSASMFTAYFGDGSDGDVTVSGTASLTKEMHYNNLTITGTGVVKPQGFRVFVKGTLTIESGGTFNDAGNPGGVSGTTNAGAALSGSRGYLGAGGGGGGSGRSSTGAGTNGASAGGNCSPNNSGVQPTGGAGGAGGVSAGGTAGPAVALSPSQKWNAQALFYGARHSGGTWNGGGGGGGGGCLVTAGSASSGGGGGGAGIVWLSANTVSNAGTIHSNGGNGADAIGTTGVAGGGGGGGGGLVAVITRSSSYGSITSTGGTGGTGFNTGADGANGNDGSVVVLVVA